jgi:DNA-binding NarL/FixJ family response regulator
MKIRLAIVDDKIQNRAPLSGRLMALADVELVFTASDGEDFLEKAKTHQPVHVVLMDVEMPALNGIQTVAIASELYPETRFIMLTVFDDEDKIFEAIKAGACGYLLKDESVETILDGIKQAVELGGAPMSPGIARKALSLLSKATVENKSVTPTSEISEREMEILKWLVNGLEYKAIAEKLFLSPHTVRKHIGNIYTKLHVNSKAQVIRLAFKKNWV